MAIKKSNKVGRRPKPPTATGILKDIVPVADLFNDEELKLYNSLVDIYMQDFEGTELTSMDIDDIMSLAMNKVFEVRLLRTSKDNPEQQMDITTSIERMKKQNEKIKENLLVRRKDRVSSNDIKGITIVDLAVAFDQKRKEALEKKARKLKQEEKEIRKKLEDYGNRDDKI